MAETLGLRRVAIDTDRENVADALFAKDALARLAAAGVDHVWSSDSIPHQSNRLALAPLLAQALPTPVAAR